MVNHIGILSLCTGIGGLDLGIKLALGDRARLLGCVERDAFAASVLLARMEDEALERAPVWCGDLRDLDRRSLPPRVDLVSAGYPCQPFSVAGKRRGEEDERHLWPEVARIIGLVGPRYVFLENVPGHVRLGFDAVLGDLAELGFDAEWGLFSAAGIGAPHRRQRLFILGYARCSARGAGRRLAHRIGDLLRNEPGRLGGQGGAGEAGAGHACEDVADAARERIDGTGRAGPRRRGEHPDGGGPVGAGGRAAWPPGPQGDWSGVPEWAYPAVNGKLNPIFVENLMGLPLGWTYVAARSSTGSIRRRSLPVVAPLVRQYEDALQFMPPKLALALRDGAPEEAVAEGLRDRADRLRALGNAVVPLCAAHALRVLWKRWRAKRCELCQGVMVPKGSDYPKRWTGRRFCSLVCANRSRSVNPVTTRYRSRRVNGKRVAEHRLVAEAMLGRKLRKGEVVHHKDGDKLNNAPTNLIVESMSAHSLRHHPPKLPAEKVCEICGATFRPHKTKRRRQRACGWTCGQKLNSLVQPGLREMPLVAAHAFRTLSGSTRKTKMREKNYPFPPEAGYDEAVPPQSAQEGVSRRVEIREDGWMDIHECEHGEGGWMLVGSNSPNGWYSELTATIDALRTERDLWKGRFARGTGADAHARIRELEAEVERRNASPAAKWEGNIQGEHLKRHGLAEEFPYGCDSIDFVAEALLGNRAALAAADEALLGIPLVKDGQRWALRVREGLMLGPWIDALGEQIEAARKRREA